MTGQPLHLAERAAQQLRQDGHVASGLLATPVAGTDAGAPPPAFSASPLQALLSPVLPSPAPPLPTPPLPGAPLPSGPPPSPANPSPPGLDAAALAKAGMIDWTAHRDRLSEEFRIVQSQVLQIMAAASVKAPALANLVMLTSARPGEGKTFTSLNLAGSLASSSQQAVILVDVDSLRHSLTSRLRLDAAPGLLDLAANPALDAEAVLAGTSLPNLRVLPVGQGARGEAQGGGKPVVNVLERLGRQFPNCIVVLDTPPCLSSSDPSTLAPLVGQVIMLVEAQQTQRVEVEAALDLVEACPSVVLLLNKVQMTASDTFGAYGY